MQTIQNYSKYELQGEVHNKYYGTELLKLMPSEDDAKKFRDLSFAFNNDAKDRSDGEKILIELSASIGKAISRKLETNSSCGKNARQIMDYGQSGQYNLGYHMLQKNPELRFMMSATIDPTIRDFLPFINQLLIMADKDNPFSKYIRTSTIEAQRFILRKLSAYGGIAEPVDFGSTNIANKDNLLNNPIIEGDINNYSAIAQINYAQISQLSGLNGMTKDNAIAMYLGQVMQQVKYKIDTRLNEQLYYLFESGGFQLGGSEANPVQVYSTVAPFTYYPLGNSGWLFNSDGSVATNNYFTALGQILTKVGGEHPIFLRGTDFVASQRVQSASLSASDYNLYATTFSANNQESNMNDINYRLVKVLQAGTAGNMNTIFDNNQWNQTPEQINSKLFLGIKYMYAFYNQQQDNSPVALRIFGSNANMLPGQTGISIQTGDFTGNNSSVDMFSPNYVLKASMAVSHFVVQPELFYGIQQQAS